MEETPVGQTAALDEDLTQANYQETAYADASWEIVGSPPKDEVFIPMEVDTTFVTTKMIDPMFADYGGLKDSESIQRWHLPEGQAVGLAVSDEVEEEDDSIRLQQEELEKIKKQAYDEGYKAAVEGEVSKNAERMTTIEQRLRTLITDLNQQIAEHQTAVEKNTVKFALDISKKIVDTAVEINPEYITDIVREALSHAGTAEIKKVRVSPDDLEFIALVGLGKTFKEYDGSWEFEADPTIKAGCILDSSAGEIDYQLDPAWERVKESVMKVLR